MGRMGRHAGSPVHARLNGAQKVVGKQRWQRAHLIKPGTEFGRQLEVQRAQAVLQLFEPGGAQDHRGVGFGLDPGQDPDQVDQALRVSLAVEK